MKKIMIIMAGLALISVSVLAAGPKVEMKTSGPSGQGNLIWWAPSSGTTNLVMTTNGITVLKAAPGAAVVWTNASLTITRQAVASATNGTVAITITPQYGTFTNLNAATNPVVQVLMTNVLCTAAFTPQAAAVAAVTNVVLSNP